jgi:hypothetical protein
MTVNNRAKTPKHTEQAIVVAPAAYWQHFLEPWEKGVLVPLFIAILKLSKAK